MYDLVIVGGGPAGVGAGVYAARKKIKSLLVTDTFGGQSLVSPGVENWIGAKLVTGFELAKMLEDHLRRYQQAGDLEIWDSDLVEKIEPISRGKGFSLITKGGKKAEAKTALVCSGSRRRRLGVPGEDRLDGKGIAWCATCDAPLFDGKVVAVIGGGNAGLEAILTLDAYVSKLYLIQRSDRLKGDAVTQDKIKSLKKLAIIYNALTEEILGEAMVNGLRYKDSKTGKEKILKLEGIFIEIGSIANNDFVRHLVKINDYGELVIDPRTQKTSRDGIWAAGDVTDVFYKQNNVSVGDAVKAVLNIFDYLQRS